jgi:hypothetical protein
MNNIKTSKLIDDLNKFKLAHYESADFDGLIDKLNKLYVSLKRLKDQKKKNRVVLDLYTLYIQIIELFFTNTYALRVPVDNFPSALFISNNNLHKFIEDNFIKTTDYSVSFLTKIIFVVSKTNEDTKDRYVLYSNLLQEVVKDYLAEFDLLNAYKHGYRINAKHDKSTLSLITNSGQSIKLSESDSTIVYFSKLNADLKENKKEAEGFGVSGGQVVIENTLSFKADRVFGKALFVCSLLNNIRAAALLHYKQKIHGKEISSFSITDKKEWSKTVGESHFKKPIFVFGGPNKKNEIPK